MGFSEDTKFIEARELSKQPSFPRALGEVKKFPRLAEAYLSDWFGLRKQFITFHNTIFYLMGISPPDGSVTVGKEGWLYYRGVILGKEGWALPKGVVLAQDAKSNSSPVKIKKFSLQYQKVHAALSELGIQFIVAIAPDKMEVYPEYLPAWADLETQKQMFDDLSSEIHKYPHLNYLDLRESLQKANPDIS